MSLPVLTHQGSLILRRGEVESGRIADLEMSLERTIMALPGTKYRLERTPVIAYQLHYQGQPLASGRREGIWVRQGDAVLPDAAWSPQYAGDLIWVLDADATPDRWHAHVFARAAPATRSLSLAAGESTTVWLSSHGTHRIELEPEGATSLELQMRRYAPGMAWHVAIDVVGATETLALHEGAQLQDGGLVMTVLETATTPEPRFPGRHARIQIQRAER